MGPARSSPVVAVVVLHDIVERHLVGPERQCYDARACARDLVRQPRGRPRKRLAKLHADKGYDFGRCRRDLRARHIIPRMAWAEGGNLRSRSVGSRPARTNSTIWRRDSGA